jgi:hypothetical protein
MAAEQPIPVYKDLASLYASLGTATSHACVHLSPALS